MASIITLALEEKRRKDSTSNEFSSLSLPLSLSLSLSRQYVYLRTFFSMRFSLHFFLLSTRFFAFLSLLLPSCDSFVFAKQSLFFTLLSAHFPPPHLIPHSKGRKKRSTQQTHQRERDILTHKQAGTHTQIHS